MRYRARHAAPSRRCARIQDPFLQIGRASGAPSATWPAGQLEPRLSSEARSAHAAPACPPGPAALPPFSQQASRPHSRPTLVTPATPGRSARARTPPRGRANYGRAQRMPPIRRLTRVAGQQPRHLANNSPGRLMLWQGLISHDRRGSGLSACCGPAPARTAPRTGATNQQQAGYITSH